MQRLRILVSAFSCSPYRGSEPGIGWNISSRLGQYHDITVLYSQRHQDDVNRYLGEQGPVPGVEFRPVAHAPLAWVYDAVTEFGFQPAYYMGYRKWQKAALLEARRLHAERPFDLAHQLNMIGYREPGYLWRLGVPFVWGPIGGAVNMPWRFVASLRPGARVFYAFRNVANSLQMRFQRRPQKAAAAARHLWVATCESESMVRQIWGRECELLTETGTKPEPSAGLRRFDGSRSLRVAWCSIHVGRKGLPLLLRAMVRIGKGVEVTVFGTGPETQSWKRLAIELGVSAQIRWLGMVPYAEMRAELGKMDLLAFTGVQEGTPQIVMDALSSGLPVLCHDAYGMQDVITPECGIKVPLVSPAQSAQAFAAAITAVAVDPCRIEAMSHGALHRAAQLSWDQKARQIAERYESVLRHRASAGECAAAESARAT